MVRGLPLSSYEWLVRVITWFDLICQAWIKNSAASFLIGSKWKLGRLPFSDCNRSQILQVLNPFMFATRYCPGLSVIGSGSLLSGTYQQTLIRAAKNHRTITCCWRAAVSFGDFGFAITMQKTRIVFDTQFLCLNSDGLRVSFDMVPRCKMQETPLRKWWVY